MPRSDAGDPEFDRAALESAQPVAFAQQSVRAASGSAGRQCGRVAVQGRRVYSLKSAFC